MTKGKKSQRGFTKYRKKKHCRYPFSPEPLGYCWSYANAVDEGIADEEFEKATCNGCKFYDNDKA